jgi:hypothetical protein
VSASVDIQAFIKSLREDLQPRAERAAMIAVDRFANHVITEAITLAPRDTGDLKASGKALPAVNNNGLITAEIGFNIYYAAAVHERLDLTHKEGQAKFLETALRANIGRMKDYVIDAIKKEIG